MRVAEGQARARAGYVCEGAKRFLMYLNVVVTPIGRESSVCDARPCPDHAKSVSLFNQHSAARERNTIWRTGLLSIFLSCLPLAMYAQSGQPALISPAPGSTLPGGSVTFTWTTGSGAIYELWLGTKGVGSDNIGVYFSPSSTASTISITATGIPTGGGTIYARLVTLAGGTWSATDYTYSEESAGGLSGVSCSKSSLTGSGSDACTVTLAAAAPSGGTTVSLASNNGAVSVPGSVTVAAGATSTGFTATASAVSSQQTVKLTASAAGASSTATLQLNPATEDYEVNLNWDAPSDTTDPDSIAGYNVYRAPSGSSAFQLLNTSLNVPTSYTDSTVTSGSSYEYRVTTVDTAGNESAPSNVYTATVP